MLPSSEEQCQSHRGKFESIFKERPCLTLLGAAALVRFGPGAQLDTPNSWAQVLSLGIQGCVLG